MSLMCQVCNRNNISVLKPPFGGFICAKEHFQCSDCNKEAGKCQICQGPTQFLQFTIIKSEGLNEVNAPIGRNDLESESSHERELKVSPELSKLPQVVLEEEDLNEIVRTVSNFGLDSDTATSNESLPIITLLPSFQNQEQSLEKKTSAPAKMYVEDSYLRDYDTQAYTGCSRLRSSSNPERPLNNENGNENDLQSLQSLSSNKTWCPTDGDTSVPPPPTTSESYIRCPTPIPTPAVPSETNQLNDQEAASESETSGTTEIWAANTAPFMLPTVSFIPLVSTDLIEDVAKKAKVIFVQNVQRFESSTSVTSNHICENASVTSHNDENQKKNVSIETLSRKTVPVVLMPLDEVLKNNNLTQNVAFQAALLALRGHKYLHQTESADSDGEWTNIHEKTGTKIKNYRYVQPDVKTTVGGRHGKQDVEIETKVERGEPNQIHLTTHLKQPYEKDRKLKQSAGYTVLTRTTFGYADVSNESLAEAMQEENSECLKKQKGKEFKNVAIGTSREFDADDEESETVKNWNSTNANGPETDEKPAQLAKELAYQKKYVVMQASKSMPGALGAGLKAVRNIKDPANEKYMKLLQTFQESKLHDGSAVTIIEEPGKKVEQKGEVDEEDKLKPETKPDKSLKTQAGEGINEVLHHDVKAGGLGGKDQKKPNAIDLGRMFPASVQSMTSSKFERPASKQVLASENMSKALLEIVSEKMSSHVIEDELCEVEPDESELKLIPEAHMILLNRAPLKCPESGCNFSLFVSDFCQHLVFDHINVPLERVLPNQLKIFFCDVRSLTRGVQRCIMCYFVRNVIKNIGATDFKDYLPVMIMATRVSRQEICYFGETPPPDDPSTDFYFFWITGLVPEKRPIHYDLTIWPLYCDESGLFQGYTNYVYSLRNSQDPFDIWNQASGILLYPKEVQKLTNNYKDVLVLKLTIK